LGLYAQFGICGTASEETQHFFAHNWNAANKDVTMHATPPKQNAGEITFETWCFQISQL